MTPSEQFYSKIPLTRGKFAIVDESDFDWLNQWKWGAKRELDKEVYYAVRTQYLGGGRASRKQAMIFMHREILGLRTGDNLMGDHINGDTLDNRRVNLRTASNQSNSWNQKIRSTNTSGFKGVSKRKSYDKWEAHIRIGGKTVRLGGFSSPEEAYEAYCKAAREVHGEFFHA